MTSTSLTPEQLDFLAVLEAFTEPVPIQSAAVLSSITAGDLFALVRRLTAQGWIEEATTDCFGLTDRLPLSIRDRLKTINSRDRLIERYRTITDQGLANSLPRNGYRSFLYRCEQCNEIAELVYREAEVDIDNGRYDHALQNLITCLTFLKNQEDDLKHAPLYIEAVLKLSVVAQPQMKSWEQAEQYLVRARMLAERLGDQRQLVFIDLSLGIYYLGACEK